MRRARLLVEDGVNFKEIVDTKTQALLRHVSERAREKGMSINEKKTGLMLVSAATSFQARTRVSLDEETIHGKDCMKVLGVTLTNDLSFYEHVEKIAAKTRAKTWALSKLRRKGLSEKNLIKTYKCLIRPSLEYAAAAWHSLLTAGQSALLERQQSQALKNIFGPSLSAATLRKKADIETLHSRREALVTRFAKKSLANPRTNHWFKERPVPSYARRSGVRYPKYREETARTDRHRNNPKNYLVRKLNECV